MSDRIHSVAESDEYTHVEYVAQRPRRRDFWRVLIGRYEPQVRRVKRLTLKGYDRALREVWTQPMVERFADKSYLLDRFENRGEQHS
jgi:hypothetical protein